MDGEMNGDTAGANTSSSTLGGSARSIFGDAKPRDEQSWRSQKESAVATTVATASSNTEMDVARSSNSTNQEKRPSTPHQHQSGRDLKNSGRGNGNGRTGTRGGRGGSDGNNRGSGRAYSGGRGNNNNATGEQSKYDKQKGSDSVPTPASKRKSDQKKAETITAPNVATLPASKPVEPEKKPPAKPTNIFAALALDDSDSE
jgi:hypothetical protein